MTARLAVSGALCAALFLAERSFVASLPEPWMRLPLVLCVGVYLVQHLSLRDGAAWIALAGAFSDAFALTPAPTGTLAGLAAAFASVALSRRAFTNRSLWGILACGGTALLVHAAVLSLALFAFFPAQRAAGWAAPLEGLPWALALGSALLWALFRLARRVRRLLSGALRVNRETL